jgi:hypothetical protein
MQAVREKKGRKEEEEEVSGMWVLDFWVTRTFLDLRRLVVRGVQLSGRGRLSISNARRASLPPCIAPTADLRDPLPATGATEKGQQSQYREA